MKRVLVSAVVTTAIAVAAGAVPAEAAVIHQVQNKVDAIKKETAAINSRASDLQTKVKAQALEIAEIQNALDKLKLMKTRLGQAGIDPAEVLEMVPLEDLRAAMDEAKENRAALQQMLSDPGIETFRAEFVRALADINRVVTGEAAPEVTPFQTLIEKAPKPLIAILKAATETAFEPLEESIAATVQSMEELRALGLLPVSSRSAEHFAPGPRLAAHTVSNPPGLSADQAAICTAIGNFGIDKVYSILWTFQNNMLKVKQNHVWVSSKAFVLLKRAFPQLPDMGIHGYLTLRLSGVKPEESFKTLSEAQLEQIELAMERNDHRMRKLEWLQGTDPARSLCGALATSAGSGGPSPATPALTRSAPAETGPWGVSGR